MTQRTGARERAWTPSSSLGTDHRTLRGEWREGGFRALGGKQRTVVVLAAAVVLVLVASLLVVTVRSITAPEPALRLVDGDPRVGIPAVAAGVTMARLIDSDPGYRFQAYLEDVDPSIVNELRGSFEPGITAMLQSSGAGKEGSLRTEPLGYRTTFEDGRLVALSLWTRRTTAGPGGDDETVSYPVLDVMMKWTGKRWVLINYFGSEAGPTPGAAAAEIYTPLATAAAA